MREFSGQSVIVLPRIVRNYWYVCAEVCVCLYVCTFVCVCMCEEWKNGSFFPLI